MSPPDRERRLAASLERALGAVARRQKEDGSWDAPCETDPSPTAFHLLLRRYLGRPDADLEAGLAASVRSAARPEGGWAAYPGGPADPDLTALGYAALKAAGMPADDPVLRAARTVFRSGGGWGATSFYGRLMPAFLGQIPLRALPSVSPAILALPRSTPLHPDRQPMHVRTTVIPLAFLLREGCVRPLPEGRGIADLADGPPEWTAWPATGPLPPRARWLRKSAESLGRISRWVDRIFPPADWGGRVLEEVSRLRNADGSFGGFFLSTVLSLMALDNVSGPKAEGLVDQGLAGLDKWVVKGPGLFWQEFLPSAVANTAVALQALQAGGRTPDSPPVGKGLDWLVRAQSRRPGPWAVRLAEKAAPGGWAFGAETDLFPECDTTSIVLRALTPLRGRCPEAFDRGVNWLLAFQDRRGGWAAWDRGNKRRVLFPSEAFVPYQDLPDPEITARVLFALGPLALGGPDVRTRRAVGRALAYLWRSQRPDGSWPGHWVVNFASGTSHVLQGVSAAGVSGGEPRVRKAVSWLLGVQNGDGGWGESKASGRTGRFEGGASNAFLTAVVLRGLLAVGPRDGEAIRTGLDFLLQTQGQDGLWTDPDWYGIALAGKLYLRYELIPSCVAVLAIADYLKPEKA
ncbi:MAG: hypothetical protein FJY80_07070 [Candidatus Aminicenantes bacterium]|nr:hypothetical protein [Candidatus Aminicenantes bacterium]